MADVYKPGAVSSLIHLETSPAEKSKEQKKLDKLFGKSTKKSSTSSISQIFNNVSRNVTVDLKSSKKKTKKKSKTDECSDKPVLSLPKKDKKLTNKKNTPSPEKKKKDKNKTKKPVVVKEKKRNSEEISSPSFKKTKKFKEIATTTTESADDRQKSFKKAKKRKISPSEAEVAVQDGQKNDDEPNERKRKKFNKKNNKIPNGTTSTEKPGPSEPKTKKRAPPVINDVLCALKETDGSKTRKRSSPKDLSDLEDEGDQTPTRPKKRKRDQRNDFRTVFVGNLPLSTTKRELKRLFSVCGEVENLRMRGAIPANPQRGKKYAILKQAYHSKCRSINAYICFADKESAEKACELMNGKDVEGQHIRVNSSIVDKTAHDHKRSVFVGNLPFAIAEEDVRKHFLDCGEIANIRLVKDWKTGVGKGFGYVKFEEVDSADLAVRLDNSKLNNRQIRVYPSEADPKKRRMNKSHDKGSKDSEKSKVKKSDQKDFVGIKAEKKKKKKKPKHMARKMGLTTKKKDLPAAKPVEKVTGGPNKHMVFE